MGGRVRTEAGLAQTMSRQYGTLSDSKERLAKPEDTQRKSQLNVWLVQLEIMQENLYLTHF